MARRLNIDWVLFLATSPIVASGLITMRAFGVENDYFFTRQVIWVLISFAVFFVFSFVDWRFLKKGELLLFLFGISILVLAILLILGKAVKGAASWFDLKLFAVEPIDPIKLLLILILAKYFSRRHIEIAHFKHMVISAIYAVVPAALVFFQPDFGSALIIFLVWLGMILVSGVSKKHLLVVFLIAVLVFAAAWVFFLKPYQKNRILTFFDPLRDARGAGYNALQSVIAVGSGQILGRGIGYGNQSRLGFLPEHETDFIFASFAEEWGLIGVLFLFVFYALVIWRIIRSAYVGQSNFETLFGLGLAILIMAHFIVNVGMNIGLLPITGVNLSFMSYGGTHMFVIYAGLGMLMGMRRYSRQAHPQDMGAEFLGPK